jgi:hypothetical protein
VNCSQIRHLIERNPLSNLGAKNLENIRAHAATCPTCAEILESAAELEQALTGLPEVEVRTELCDRVMESISTEIPTPDVGLESRRILLAQFLKNMSFVIATVALVTGVHGTQWLGHFLSFDLALKLGWMSAIPSSSTSAGLTALACLLFLAGFVLTDRVSSRSGLEAAG